ncbi:hypothetical protein ACFQ1L_16125 [Phytohabitans flavus]|nr:hypothetical protein [Phytohabitans flavus]
MTGRASPVIGVDELNVTYGDFHAVKDLSFHVERGSSTHCSVRTVRGRPRPWK